MTVRVAAKNVGNPFSGHSVLLFSFD